MKHIHPKKTGKVRHLNTPPPVDFPKVPTPKGDLDDFIFSEQPDRRVSER